MTPRPPSSPWSQHGEHTDEVGSEGGTPGDLEQHEHEVGTGSEADTLWRPADAHIDEVRRDDTGEGRRSP